MDLCGFWRIEGEFSIIRVPIYYGLGESHPLGVGAISRPPRSGEDLWRVYVGGGFIVVCKISMGGATIPNEKSKTENLFWVGSGCLLGHTPIIANFLKYKGLVLET